MQLLMFVPIIAENNPDEREKVMIMVLGFLQSFVLQSFCIYVD